MQLKYFLLIGLVFVLLAFANEANAGGAINTTWTGATSTAWNTAGNWNNGVPNVNVGSIVTIPAAPTNQPTIGGTNRSAGVLVLETGASISGTARLTLLGATITVNSSGTTSAAISCNLRLSANTTITVNDNATADIDLDISGIVTQNGGPFNITKSGSGTLELSNINTYTGSTIVSAGILRATTNDVTASANGPFGNNASGINLNGGTIQSNVATFSRPITVTATNSGLDAYGSARTISSNINLATAGTFNLNIGGTTATSAEGQDLTLSGIISNSTGTLGLTKIGTSKVILTGPNTYTGATTVSAGVLNIRNAQGPGTTAGGVTVASGAALELQGGITVGAETLSLNNNGVGSGGALRNISGDNTWGGTITLSTNDVRINSDLNTLTLNAANSITATNINLMVGGTGNTNISGTITTGSGTLTKDGSGTVTLSGANTYTGNTTISSGILKIQGVAFSTTARNYSISSGAVLNIDGNTGVATGTSTLSGTGTLRITGSSGTMFGNEAPNSPAGGGRNISMSLGSDALIDVQSGAMMLNGGWQNIDWTNNKADMDVDGTFDIWDGQPVFVDALTGSGTIDRNYAGNSITLTVGADNGNGVFSGIIKNTSGTIALAKTGSGSQTLSGANTYTGGTTLSSGQLNINHLTAIGSGTLTITSGTTIDNTSGGAIGPLTNNNAQTWNGSFTFAGSNDLNMGTGTITMGADVTITSSTSGKTLTVGGVNNNSSRSLTKEGTGNLAFGSTAVTLNNLTLSAGTLTSTSGTLSLAGNYSNSGIFTHNSGTLTFNGSGAQTINSGGSSFNNFTVTNTGGICSASTNGITVAGTFTTNASTTLDMATNVLSVNTAAHSGSLKTQNTSGTPITTGKTWGGTVTFDGGNAQTIPASTFNDLTLNNSAGADLGGAVTVSGILTLTSGLLTTTATNLLSITNTSTSAISGSSSTSFINGPLQWSLSTGTYIFPVGKGAGNYFPFTLATSAAASPVVTVETFNSDVGAGATFDATLISISHTEYWKADLAPGGTFTGKVSLTRTAALTNEDVIGKSTLQSGDYSSIGGTASSPSIINSDNISSFSYFVMAAAKKDCPVSNAVTPSAEQTVCQDVATNQLTATITTSGGKGTPTLKYQWYYNTTNSNTVSGATKISGATSQTYTPLSGSAEAGTTRYYFCVGYALDNGCGQTDADQSLASTNTVKVTVSVQPTGPALLAKTPNLADVCEGTVVSATFTAGSGGVGCSDTYQYSTNNGSSWNTYNPGNDIGTSGATVVLIQGKRDDCSSGAGCTGTNYSTLASWTVNALPTITLTDPTPIGCQGLGDPYQLLYSATSGSPNQYSIDYDDAANTAGFSDISNAALGASPINNPIPAGIAQGTYNGTFTVRNSITGCISVDYPITVTLATIDAAVFNVTGLGDDSTTNSSSIPICPQLIPPDFVPESGSYNPGATFVVFRIDRLSSLNNWNFSYTLSIYDPDLNDVDLTVMGVIGTGDITPPIIVADDVDAGNNNSIFMRFKIENDPTIQVSVTVTFAVDFVTDSECMENSGNTSNNEASQTINPMPAVGSFN